MNVPWDELREAHMRAAARRQALDVVSTAFGALSARLEHHITVGHRMDTKRALQIMKSEMDKIIIEMEKELKGS